MGASAQSKNQTTRNDSFTRAAAVLVDEFRSQRPLRAGSLLITIFGDSIAPHGGTVWLGGLIRALESFGINQRLVRTSVFRLVKDGWLTTQQIGRRSFYSLTIEGRRRFADASRRIYGPPQHDWAGEWTMVLLSGVDSRKRDHVRKTLRWLGFAPFSTNLMAHPALDMRTLETHLAQIPERDQLLIMRSRIDDRSESQLRDLVSDGWQLEDLAARYLEFLHRFRPVYQAARRIRQLDADRAFQVRTLLVHEYRKILLRDPRLPEPLLPPRWEGQTAYQLCRNLYRLVATPTEAFLVDRLETADGPLPPAEPQYMQRFGGLDPAVAEDNRK